MLLMIGLALGCPPDNVAHHAGVDFHWHFDGDVLHGRAQAPGPGWIAVGFNDRAELAGTRLVMLAVHDGVPVGEEHRAEPPRHPRHHVLDEVAGERDGGGVDIVFTIPLDRPALLTLAPGDAVWLTLAWSRSPDFDHHSVRREARWIRL